jgi:hypothetical protein
MCFVKATRNGGRGSMWVCPFGAFPSVHHLPHVGDIEAYVLRSVGNISLTFRKAFSSFSFTVCMP